MTNYNDDVIKTLEDTFLKLSEEENILIQSHNSELALLHNRIDIIQDCLNRYKQSSGIIIADRKAKKQIDINTLYPGYPDQGTLIDKFKYFEDTDHKVWKLKDMVQRIKGVEGNSKKNKTLKGLAPKMKNFIRENKIISVAFNNAGRYTFYTTNQEWVQKDDKTGGFLLMSDHMPEKEQLGNLDLKTSIITIKGKI